MEETPNYQNSSIINNSQLLDNIIDYQDYYLINNNIIYKIIIGKNGKEVFIKCKNYLISFNQIELSALIKIQINSLDEAFNYIIELFEDNKVKISNIRKCKEIKLIIESNSNKNFELLLIYNKYINQIYKQIIDEINILKIEVNKLKKYHEINNPKDIQLLSNIVDDSYAYTDLDNSFTVFKTINDILYLIYSNKNKSIICYDLNEQKKLKN